MISSCAWPTHSHSSADQMTRPDTMVTLPRGSAPECWQACATTGRRRADGASSTDLDSGRWSIVVQTPSNEVAVVNLLLTGEHGAVDNHPVAAKARYVPSA